MENEPTTSEVELVFDLDCSACGACIRTVRGFLRALYTAAEHRKRCQRKYPAGVIKFYRLPELDVYHENRWELDGADEYYASLFQQEPKYD